MLRVTAPATEIARLGEVLRTLARDDAEGFDALFDPARPKLAVRGIAPALAGELRAFGLVDGDGDALQGQHRIRRIGEGPSEVHRMVIARDLLRAGRQSRRHG